MFKGACLLDYPAHRVILSSHATPVKSNLKVQITVSSGINAFLGMMTIPSRMK